MATWYVSPYGHDGLNNGKGPDPTDPANRPYKSVGTVLGSSGISPGDTVYFAPGIYYTGAAINPPASISSAGSPTTFEGDPLNVQGFKDLSGTRLPPGLVWWTVRSAADAKTAFTSSNNFMTPNNNGGDGLTFRNLVIESKHDNSGSVMTISPATNTDYLFEDCRLIGSSIASIANAAPIAGLNWTFRRCVMYCSQVLQSNIATAPATADVDMNILVEHCKVYGRLVQDPLVLGTATAVAGGIRFKGNLVMCTTGRSVSCTAARVSTVVPITMEGNLVIAQGVAGGTQGQVVSLGYNQFTDTVAASNFQKLGTDVSFGMLDLVEDDLVKWGLALPQQGFLSWTTDADSSLRQSGWVNTGADFRNRTARPWGMGASIGCFETPIILKDTTSQLTGGGATSLAICGAGELVVPVQLDPVATTLTVVTKSAAYVGTNYPQAILQANPSIGVAQTTATATDATQQTLTIAVTPTDAGVATLRLVSRNAGLGGWTFFDVLTAA